MTVAIDLKRLSRAERLLWGYGVTEPHHIDLVAIANDRQAQVICRPLDGCEARLVVSEERAVISVNASATEGRRNFSLAHELAHWICDRGQGSFLCAKDDIGPQNAEAKSVEANANSFASQLILPDYLVAPWIGKRTPTLELASALSSAFKSSLTAAAIKLANRAIKPACVTCHASSKLIWFRKNRAFPSELFVLNMLHHDTDAFEMSFVPSAGLSRLKRSPGHCWFYGREGYLPDAQSQSVRLPDGTVLSMISLLA
jgi:Zn-dependent peptidase ImmA (M78 family)